MAKFYALGNYTTQGFQGFCKDPGSDRSNCCRSGRRKDGIILWIKRCL